MSLALAAFVAGLLGGVHCAGVGLARVPGLAGAVRAGWLCIAG